MGHPLADRDSSYRITAPSPNAVRISDGDIAHQLDITLDAVSSLPVKITSISLSDPAHPIPSDEVTTEWETVQGVRFARRWTVFRSGVRVAEATVERTTVNTGDRTTSSHTTTSGGCHARVPRSCWPSTEGGKAQLAPSAAIG
jgi:hypothetical protein